MKLAGLLLLAALAGASGLSISSASLSSEGTAANPIRRVVTLLQDMQKKIVAEGERDEEIFETYMCYCKSSGGELSKTIAEAETKVPQVSSALEKAEALKVQLEAELAKHKEDRADAKESMAKANALREKEAAAYAKESGDMKTNIAALGNAVTALEKGMTGFLQTDTGRVLKRLAIDMELSSVDRDLLASFLATGSRNGYVPQSGEITGILKEMKGTMEKELAAATDAEKQSVADMEAMAAAKTKEIGANSKAIEEKTVRLGNTGVEIVTLKEDLDDTQMTLLGDQKFMADLEANCKTREEEYGFVKKTRAEELLAIAETVKILNDDDSLDLFKKTLPSPSLIQTKVASREVKKQALKAINAAKRAAGGRNHQLDLIALALSGKKVSFDKVLKMIDDMVALLGKEQTDDDAKKAYCEAELDKTEDKGKSLDQSISDLAKDIDDAKGMIATLTEGIEALEEAIKALDKSVAEATENRKKENEEYQATMAGDTAAKELLGIAKNRLNKFYNPTLYKAPPKRELSAEERISVSMGGTLPPTAAPGGIAGTGVTVLEQVPALVQVRLHNDGGVAPPPPPQAVAAYKTKGQETAGVLTMVDMLIADMDKEMQEMTVEEKDAQKEYEEMTADAAAKRASDSKSIADKESAKADLEAQSEKMAEEKKSKTAEAMATAETLKDLHLECDWLTANYEARKEARAGEVESLKSAKAVLSGADYSL